MLPTLPTLQQTCTKKIKLIKATNPCFFVPRQAVVHCDVFKRRPNLKKYQSNEVCTRDKRILFLHLASSVSSTKGKCQFEAFSRKIKKSQPSITCQETDIHGSYYVHLKNGFGGNNKRNLEYSGI